MLKNKLKKALGLCMIKDRFAFRRKLERANGLKDGAEKARALELLSHDINKSASLLEARNNLSLDINYPDLPVSDKRDDIKNLIKNNQVVIIAGETGSGKTTQLPKMCLELGRGRAGMIAHSQPRRLAARNVANRIAEELGTQLGETVGYKVRFTDQVTENTLVKLLTDGMLLAEMQQDRFLEQYDTIIIDEAHERSLNIDFLLGYIKRILPKRPDLKVIITSATIDPERFSKHFNDAPIIEVSGRSFPVDIQYRDFVEQELAQDQSEAIILAVDELFALARGDILVFLSGEREIRETQQALLKRQYRNTEVIPLYARLSASDQQKIFHPQGQRRIVLATNVAETSLTVPGIKYVIDTGMVRMSRYSHRLKVQRLPIEPISQASAKQRAGRCGRTSSGVCIRLYGEQDFLSRDEFTDPEITRTHLSSVILQMLSLGLGEISDFDFIQAPEEKFIKDGVRLLTELQAVEQSKRGLRLTSLGRKMARLPLDPKYASMLISAGTLNCVYEIMVITAGLSVQDPRERPLEKKQKADEAHAIFKDNNSDFISLLNLYEAFKSEQKALTQNQLRKWCIKHFVHYQRMREWQDIVHQIKHTLVSVDLRLNSEPSNYENIHRALAIGLLSQVGMKEGGNQYLGARNSQFKIFPGSAVFAKQPKWIIASELVQTSQLFARQVAKIEAQWLEGMAKHLMKLNYIEPHWSKKRGAVMAYLNGTLFGLPVIVRRLINYSQVNPRDAKHFFIRHALVENDTKLTFSFLQENQRMIEEVRTLEEKARRRDFLVDEDELISFYDSRIPDHVSSEAAFSKWWKITARKTPDLLNFEKSLLLKRDENEVSKSDFPDVWQQGRLMMPLSYEFEPNKDYDGVCVSIPLSTLNHVQNIGFDWQVPGLRHELIVALIKSLPKRLRRNFVPAPDYARACLEELTPNLGLLATKEIQTDNKASNAKHQKDSGQNQSLVQALSQKLFRMTGHKVEEEDFDVTQVPGHLCFNFAAVNSKGKVIKRSKSLEKLKIACKSELEQSIQKAPTDDIERTDLKTFDMKTLPDRYVSKQNGFELTAYPALSIEGKSLDVKLFTTHQEALYAHYLGTIHLIKMNVPSPVKFLQEKLPNKAKLSLYFNPFGQVQLLISDIIDAAIAALLNEKYPEQEIRSQEKYKLAQEYVRMELNDRALKIAKEVESGLSLANKIQKQCKGNINLALLNQIQHIKTHLDSLVYRGFVFDYGESKLKDWNRYLSALLQRTEKLKVDANRDRLNQIEIDKAIRAFEHCKQELESQHKSCEALQEVSEMIEEFRISLFAQSQGTKYPISLKRIKNKIQDIAKNS